jgi:hypothetical protein
MVTRHLPEQRGKSVMLSRHVRDSKQKKHGQTRWRAPFVVGALLAAMFPGVANADHKEKVDWEGHGSDSIRVCAFDEDPYLHWVLTPGGNFTISEAVLKIDGDEYDAGEPFEARVAHFYTDFYDGALDGTLDATAKAIFTGSGQPKSLLVISDGCFPGVIVDKDAEAHWTREWKWDILKKGDNVDPETGEKFDLVFPHGDTTPRYVNYTVRVTAAPDDTYNVSGSVVITNHPQNDPVSIESVVDDTFDLDCDVEFSPYYVLDPGETITCTFDEDLKKKKDGTNTVTVTFKDGSTLEASADWAFGNEPDEENDRCVDLLDIAEGVAEPFLDKKVCVGFLKEDEEGNLYKKFTYQRKFKADMVTNPCCEPQKFPNIASLYRRDGAEDELGTLLASSKWAVYLHVLCKDVFTGCTPGFWKNDTPANAAAWATLFDEYGITPDSPMPVGGVTYQEALDSPENSLLFHTAAALLNALHPDVDYEYSVDEIIDIYNGEGDYADMTEEERKDLLDDANNAGCPLSATQG